MKRFGVLLALLVFGSLVGVDTVSAEWTDVSQWVLEYVNGNSYSDAHTVSLNSGVLDFHVHGAEAIWVYVVNATIIHYKAQVSYSGTSYKGGAIGAIIKLKNGTSIGISYEFDPYGDYFNLHGIVDKAIYMKWNTTWNQVTTGTINVLDALRSKNIKSTNINSVMFFVQSYYHIGTDGTTDVYLYDLEPVSARVTLNVRDGLSGQPLSGVTVKEGSNVLGTIDDGGTLELTKGTHTLTFSKAGYWNVTKTIDVQNDMTVSVEMYPDSSAVMFKNLPDQLMFYEHSTGEFSFTLSPIDTSATYDAYLSFTGLNNIVEVDKNGNAVSPENGKYYLGDITGDTAVTVKFKTGSVGTYAFSMTVQSSDGAGAKSYTTTKQVSYKINPLPFSISFPSEWQVGANQLRVSEASGSSYSMVVVLKDSSGATAWSDSYSFTPYEVHTFTVQVPKEGTYTLEFQWNGMTAEYSVSVGSGIKLLTTSITAKKGDVVSVQLSIKNSDVNTHYYTVELSGGFLDAPVNQTIAVPPASEKTVSVPVQVPSKLQFDAYDLKVAVKEGDEVKYQGTVHFVIQGSAGFSLFGGGGSGGFGGLGGGSLLLIGGLALAGVGVALISRRR